MYPERAPLTGAYHDVNGWYRLESTAGPNYPDCSAVRNVPNCNTGQTNRPCCNQYNCYLEANGHMSCLGAQDAYEYSDYSGRGFGTQSDGVIPPISGLQTMRNEIAAAGAYGVGFFAVEIFGGVRGSAGVTDSLVSPNSDPFDTEMYLILESETEVRCRMRPLSYPTKKKRNPAYCMARRSQLLVPNADPHPPLSPLRWPPRACGGSWTS